MPANQVVVSLTEKADGNAPRRITLDERNDYCLLGRASRKGTDIIAQPDNGYFENPVVSRNHAEIKADFSYERLYIKDIGSTHGTFVNNIRIPATVRHPIRSGDNITLGVEIKGQGAGLEPVRPSMMTVGVKFGTRPLAGPNVFQVPDETSVEGSDPEDTLGRARRFLVDNGSHTIYNAIDLTNDALDGHRMNFDICPPSKNLEGRHGVFDTHGPVRSQDASEEGHEIIDPLVIATSATYMPSLGKNEDMEKDKDAVEDQDLELPGESELSESEAEVYYVEEDSDDDAEEGVDDDIDDDAEDSDDDGMENGEEHRPSSEPSCTCALVDDIEPSASNAAGAGNGSEAHLAAGQSTSTGMNLGSEDNDDSTRPGEDASPLTEASSQLGEDISPSVENSSQQGQDATASTYDEDVTIEVDLDTKAASHSEMTGGRSTVSKKRKASEISKDEEPEAVVNVLSASGVQTDLSVGREPKRLRRAADIVGYTVLGGLAGALAVFTTLVLSAPSFS